MATEENQFQDIVAIMQDRRSHRPTTIRLEEIAAGRIPQAMMGSSKVEREEAFQAALNRFYQETETNI